jgi:hypothetical protein
MDREQCREFSLRRERGIKVEGKFEMRQSAQKKELFISIVWNVPSQHLRHNFLTGNPNDEKKNFCTCSTFSLNHTEVSDQE